MGIAGSAAATAIAGYVSLVALVAYLYARDLPLHAPEKLHRQAVDQQAEPVGNSWSGPQ